MIRLRLAATVLVASGFAAAGLLADCGGDQEGILVTIDSSLTIPEQIDTLVVSVTAASDGHKLGEVSRTLKAGQKFPLTIALVPSSNTPEKIIVQVTGYLGGTSGMQVAERQAEIDWVKGHVAYVLLQLISSS
jgi:hypothetical protein